MYLSSSGLPARNASKSASAARMTACHFHPELLGRFLRYRTYHGCAMPVPTQLASIAAWGDDTHVAANRRLYQEKFARVLPIL